ncbi:hypothetical protein C9439_07945 [archaeon SCG-AAA382B04]|nr:hypothetical protein C9439_07945 [archaeon SCG-AAA382B04]
MVSVKKEVEDYIDHHAAIRKNLKKQIINKRALARQIKEEIKTEASIDAIISAIRRYPTEKIQIKEKEQPKNFKLSMKDDIFDLSLLNNPKVHKKLGELPSLVDFSRGETLRIIIGVQSIKIIGDNRNLEKINQKFLKKNIDKSKKDLSEITLTFPQQAEETTGIVSEVTTELALNHINIVEVMSSAPELILVVNEKDSLKTYRTLKNLSIF